MKNSIIKCQVQLLTEVILLFSFFLLFLTQLACSDQNQGLALDENYVTDAGLRFLNTSKYVKYTGSESCKDCHLEIYEAYIKSPTGRSMSKMESSNIIETFPQTYEVYDSSKNYYYEMVLKNDSFFQREYRLGPDREVSHERWMEAQYIIGSGTNLRMYFYDENGMFYQLPLTWYVHEQKWDMSPGYREFGNIRFSRYVTTMCFSCHNGFMPQSAGANDRYEKPYPLGIGCEACHGPGELHVRQSLGEDIDLPSANALTIVNPVKLSPQRRNDVCLQCHLEGKTWALQDGNNWFDFRPGMLLEDHRSVYSPTTRKKEIFRVANTGYRLFLSRCFEGSHGNMTCDLCHDSHRMLQIDDVIFNRRNCLRCHPIEGLPSRSPEIHESSADCIPCHMNKTGTANTLHGVVNTDHWIRINSDRDIINWYDERHRYEILTFEPILDRKDSLSLIRKGIAYAEYYFTEEKKRVYLDSAAKYLYLGLNKTNNSVYGNFYFGRVLGAKGYYKQAIDYFNTALKLDPGFADAYYGIAQVHQEQKDYNSAIKYFKNALVYKPSEPRFMESLASSLYEIDSTETALEVLESSIKIDSQNPNTFFMLGNILVFNQQNPQIALRYFKKVIELDPDFPNALINLGNTYALLGRYNDAVDSYKKEIAFRPNSADAYVNLSKIYELQGNIKDAKIAFDNAKLINPNIEFK